MLDIPRSAPAVLPESGVTLEPKKPEPEAVLIPPMKKKSVVKKRKVKVLVSEIKPDTLPKVQTESLAKTEQSPLPILSAISKPRKKNIPKTVKDLCWERWVGASIAATECLCCFTRPITMSSFHCGHVIAEANGGSTTVDNLRPICATCNLSMRTKTMTEFQADHGFTSSGSRCCFYSTSTSNKKGNLSRHDQAVGRLEND